MVHPVLEEKGKKVILLGNQAIVRGALEAGVGLAATYPGTPASEIGDTFAQIARDAGIYFEYSTNEKVALETAGGAAFSGVRSLVSFKHFGLNVASDSLFPIAWVGVKGGMVVVFADDPNCWSSAQSEQDSRWYARIGHLPLMEPSDSQECKNFVKLAFEWSENYQIPFMIRLTTRVSHSSGVVTLEEIKKGKVEGEFEKSPKYFNLPPRIIEMHREILKKIEKIKEEISERSEINFIVNGESEEKIGIITSGVSFNYVMETLNELNLSLPVLKLGMTHPLPEEKISEFIGKLEKVLVVEELDPFVEEQIKIIAKEVKPDLKIYGKDVLPKAGEFGIEDVIVAVSEVIGKPFDFDFQAHEKRFKELKFPKRFPVLCPGCPHRATFYAAKIAAGDAVFAGDIGCYILGIFPPLNTTDFLLAMGASEGVTHGIKKTSKQKVISFIGDSTFFHAGIPPLINISFNKSSPLVIVLDNRITAMTGHQPHPGSGRTGMGEVTEEIKIDEIAKACKIKNVKVVDPFNFKEMKDTIKEFLEKDEAGVIVARRACQLLEVRRKRREGIPIKKFQIDQEKCIKCGTCLLKFGCPAIQKEGEKYFINEDLCTGCGVCAQICPAKAIGVKE